MTWFQGWWRTVTMTAVLDEVTTLRNQLIKLMETLPLVRDPAAHPAALPCPPSLRFVASLGVPVTTAISSKNVSLMAAPPVRNHHRQ